MPISAATHAMAANEIPDSNSCFDCGTRPKSRVLAQAKAMFSSFPMKRPANANRGARIAISRD